MDRNGFNTNCVHGCRNTYDTTGAISVPIYQTATFAHHGLGKSTGFDYSRLGNPTRESLEDTVAKLEGAYKGLAFSSGLSALTSLMEIFEAGDHIIASEDLYGGSLRLFHMVCMKRGLEFDFLDTGNVNLVKSKVRPETKAIFVETPTNPMMHVTDIAAISLVAKEVQAMLIVDNTFMTPVFQQPFSLGADIVIHSGTKYLGGHNDTLAGLLLLKDDTYLDQIKVYSKTLGAVLSPFDSWLILRGIKTLPIRMKRQEETALTLAKWLREQFWVNKVYYVGLKDHPGYEVTKKQAKGFSGMISFEVKDVGIAKCLLDHVELIRFAESLGGVETLITYPMTQTHADVPEEERNAKGINDRLLRLSVGLEDIEDLIADLENASRNRDTA